MCVGMWPVCRCTCRWYVFAWVCVCVGMWPVCRWYVCVGVRVCRRSAIAYMADHYFSYWTLPLENPGSDMHHHQFALINA